MATLWETNATITRSADFVIWPKSVREFDVTRIVFFGLLDARNVHVVLALLSFVVVWFELILLHNRPDYFICIWDQWHWSNDDVIKWQHFPRYWFLCGEFTGHRWIPRTKASDTELWCLFFICAWINGWVNNREAGDLRRHRAHYDVTAMEDYESWMKRHVVHDNWRGIKRNKKITTLNPSWNIGIYFSIAWACRENLPTLNMHEANIIRCNINVLYTLQHTSVWNYA